MPKIAIGASAIKNIKFGNTQIKEVYQGSNLVWRGFHPFVEGYKIIAFPVQGQGSTMTLPEYRWECPPGEQFDRYYDINTNREYLPGDTITFSEDFDDLSYVGIDGTTFTDSPYTYHMVAFYSSSGSGGGGSSVPSYYRVNVTGVSGIWANGSGYNIYVETRQVDGSTTASTSVTIPYFTAGLNGFTYGGKTFRRVGIIEQPEWGKYPSSSTTAPGLISSGNIVTNYTLAKNGVVKREFFEVYQGSDGKYYYFT